MRERMKMGKEVVEFVERAVSIIQQTSPDWFAEQLTTPEVFTKNAIVFVESCNKVVPLNFELLQNVENHHVLHDFMGIMNNWNLYSDPPEMLDCFHPRCAK
jgi:hypothetical protein